LQTDFSQNLLAELDAIEHDLAQGAASITGTVRSALA